MSNFYVGSGDPESDPHACTKLPYRQSYLHGPYSGLCGCLWWVIVSVTLQLLSKGKDCCLRIGPMLWLLGEVMKDRSFSRQRKGRDQQKGQQAFDERDLNFRKARWAHQGRTCWAPWAFGLLSILLAVMVMCAFGRYSSAVPGVMWALCI